MALAGHLSGAVKRWGASEAVCQYSNTLDAGPLFAVPWAFRVAPSGLMSVAG